MIILDIETVADDAFLWNDNAREIRYDSLVVPKTHKKAGTIEEWRNNKMDAEDKAGALSCVNGRVISVAYGVLWDDEVTCHTSSDPKNEECLLRTFFAEMEELGAAHTIGGWMISLFDLPFLTVRAAVHGVDVPEDWPRIGRKYDPRVYDLGVLMQSVPGSHYKLEYYLERFGIPPKTGRGSDTDTMTDEQIREYNTNDVVVERDLIRKFWRGSRR